ncbi:MAG TPA: glycosyltransferase family 2 protein [Polyangiaceae bacterium]|nr:glycosyltransferase family 2 protein [Polyangiaceae bacterium]
MATPDLAAQPPSGEREPLRVAVAERDGLDVSVVVPALNEAESLAELVARIQASLEGKARYEVVLVDDGSSDDTWKVISDLHGADGRVNGVRLRRQCGKALALAAGFRRASGEIVVMMDADLQDDPADLPRFLEGIRGGLDVVVGWKVKRDDPLNRRILSRIFNATVRSVTGLRLHDMNCGFKAFRSDVLVRLPLYGDLFRFIPAFAAADGFRVGEVPVTHHERRYGRSRYGVERILRGFFDLLSMVFLTRFRKRPMHLFGLIGLALTGIGLVTEGYLTTLWVQGHKIGDRPLLLLGALEIILGIQFFSTGLVAELLTFQNQRRVEAVDLPVQDETR